mmetsp:Transcript_59525/g.88408  ORF Transcript_59525/g.88408 Transcript_59525/m.88408 type:complete len:169 (+) Transcript_59525:449-955(+)
MGKLQAKNIRSWRCVFIFLLATSPKISSYKHQMDSKDYRKKYTPFIFFGCLSAQTVNTQPSYVEWMYRIVSRRRDGAWFGFSFIAALFHAHTRMHKEKKMESLTLSLSDAPGHTNMEILFFMVSPISSSSIFQDNFFLLLNNCSCSNCFNYHPKGWHPDDVFLEFATK